MSYRAALKHSFWIMLTAWGAAGFAAHYVWEDMKAIAAGLLSLVGHLIGATLVVLSPALIVLAPLVALLVRWEERSYARAVAKAEREIDEHYGGLHQRREP